ncbi:MAG: hypothetical protein R3Y19_04160, partial [Rikenellaceae bacterium]
VESLLGDICEGRLMEYLLSDLVYDSLDVSRIAQLVEQHLPQGQLYFDIIKMIETRESRDIYDFLLAYVYVRDMLPEEDGFKLAMTLDFVADYGSKEEKKIALRYLNEQISRTNISSQRIMLMNIKSRF